MSKKSNKVIDINDNRLMGIEDFPREIEKDMWAIVKNKGKANEEFIYAYPTEIKALSVSREFNNATKKRLLNLFISFNLNEITFSKSFHQNIH